MPKAAISDLELKHWRDRIAFSEQVWQEKGLLGNDTNLDNESLRDILQYYRGVQGNFGLYGIKDSERATVNSIFQTANTLMAQIAARAPRVTLFPQSRSAVQHIRNAQALLNYYVRELDMKRPMNAALFESMFSPLGIVRHGNTPEDDFYTEKGARIHASRAAKPDTPWIAHVNSWDFRADSTKGSFHPGEVDWCAFRSLMTADQIKATEGMRWPKGGVSPTVTIDRNKMQPRELKALQNDDFTSLIEVWSIYDSLEEKWLQWSPGAPDTTLRDPDDWPLPWDELPYDVIGINQQVDDPFPRPYMAEVAPIHRERNLVRTMISRLARDLRRLVPVNKGMLGDGMWEVLFNGDGPDLLEFIDISGPVNEAIGTVQIGGLPQELLAYDALLTEDIREITGQGKMDRAQRINVESASEAGFVQHGSDTQRGRNQAAFEDFWRSVIRKFGQGLRAVMDEERIIPIVGIEDAQALFTVQGDLGEPFLSVSPEVIQEDYLFEIAVGSTLPRNTQEEVREAAVWLEVADKHPENVSITNALIDLATALGKDPSRALLNQDEIADTKKRNKAEAEAGAPEQESPQPLSPVLSMTPQGGA